MGLDLFLISGEPLEGDFECLENVSSLRQAVAASLKVNPNVLVFISSSGLVIDDEDLIDTTSDQAIQVYIKPAQISDNEFAQLAGFSYISSMLEATSLIMRPLQVSALPSNIGRLLPHMEVLKLERNSIEFLPESFTQLCSLSSLWLNSNQLKQLPHDFGDLSNLEELHIERNQLEELPPSFVALTKLRIFWASNNRLVQLPELNTFEAVHVLDVSSNLLKMLPSNVTQLSTMKELHINDNQLSMLPSNIGDMQSLQQLGLSGNRITQLPESFSKLQALQNVWLDKGQMIAMPLESRALLRVADTVITPLEDETVALELLHVPKAKVADHKENNKGEEPEHFNSKILTKLRRLNFDDGVTPDDLATTLKRLGPAGAALSRDMVDRVMASAGKNGLVYTEGLMTWLLEAGPSVEKQLVRSALRYSPEGAQEAATTLSTTCTQPSLKRESSQILARNVEEAINTLTKADVADLSCVCVPQERIAQVVLEAVAQLLAGLVPITEAVDNQGILLESAQDLMKDPVSFLSSCRQIILLINEGKVPEENVAAARAVMDAIGASFAPDALVETSRPTACLCNWVSHVISYYDAIEGWEPEDWRP